MRVVPLAIAAFFAHVDLNAATAAQVDPASREASLLFYHDVYVPTSNVPIGWTGSHATCMAGTTSSAFRDAMMDRINYFRAMAGLPAEVVQNAAWNAKAQQAALMMSSNNQLSHFPPSTWKCYTADGAEAAGKSNLAIGYPGTSVIDAYMKDYGPANGPAGHRRWILYPQATQMGTGDVPSASGYITGNALWVIDSAALSRPRPTTRESYVAWPPPGFVPYTVTYPRWSFAYDNANLSGASVQMTENGQPITTVLEVVANGFGENTLVWRPKGIGDGADWQRPTYDTSYHVTINNVVIGGATRTFNYDVTVFDPLRPGDFNGDNRVNGADLAVWRSNAGQTSATSRQGDVDGDRDVDGSDFLAWQRNGGSEVAANSVDTVVPEPDTTTLAIIVITSVRTMARRDRRIA